MIGGTVRNMKDHLPERIVRELCSFAQKHAVTKSYCLVRVHGAQIQKEAISISQYTAEILITFIGMLKKNTYSPDV